MIIGRVHAGTTTGAHGFASTSRHNSRIHLVTLSGQASKKRPNHSQKGTDSQISPWAGLRIGRSAVSQHWVGGSSDAVIEVLKGAAITACDKAIGID
jgi:hypothetical protein